MRGRQKAFFCKFSFFGGALIIVGWGVMGCSRKTYLGLAEIASFFTQDFSWSNKHNTFWHVATTSYFYVFFLWTIAISDFYPLESYKNWGLLLFTITFRVISHTDNRFHRYMYLFCISLKYYKYEISFIIKIHVKVFSIQIWFDCKTRLLFFRIRTMVDRKKLFIEKNSFIL